MAIKYNSNYDNTIPFSDTCKQFGLLVGVAQSYTVPGDATINYSARFGYKTSSNVFVSVNVSPTSPVGGTNSSIQYMELNPGIDGSQRYLKGGDVLYFITPDASAYATVSLRSLNG